MSVNQCNTARKIEIFFPDFLNTVYLCIEFAYVPLPLGTKFTYKKRSVEKKEPGVEFINSPVVKLKSIMYHICYSDII
jgi:hypothetical protein